MSQAPSTISNLTPATTPLVGTEVLPIVQSNATVKVAINQLTSDQTLPIAAGTASLPSLTRLGDLDTGLWFPTANTMAASTGGVERFRLSSTGDLDIVTGGIGFAGGVALKQKTFNINDWDMNSEGVKIVAHGLTLANIRGIRVVIRNDSGSNFFDLTSPLSGGFEGGYISNIDSTDVYLARYNGGYFDSVLFDSTSYNRGWITIDYV